MLSVVVLWVRLHLIGLRQISSLLNANTTPDCSACKSLHTGNLVEAFCDCLLFNALTGQKTLNIVVILLIGVYFCVCTVTEMYIQYSACLVDNVQYAHNACFGKDFCSLTVF